jgi:hypothetical protein
VRIVTATEVDGTERTVYYAAVVAIGPTFEVLLRTLPERSLLLGNDAGLQTTFALFELLRMLESYMDEKMRDAPFLNA